MRGPRYRSAASAMPAAKGGRRRPPTAPTRVPGDSTRQTLEGLQRSVGNRVARRNLGEPGRHPAIGSAGSRARIRRAPLTQAEKALDLQSPQYAGDKVLEKAYDNSPPLRRGRTDPAVAKMQQGMIDDGFNMPISTRKTGSPDGIFGPETYKTVRRFQKKHTLKVDGVAGRQTIGKLDELAEARPPRRREIPPTEEKMGERVAEKMKQANLGHSSTSGIWYVPDYYDEHKKDRAKYPWKEDWRKGYADPKFFDRLHYMDWRLRPGKSASEAIKAWLKGLTIAECTSAIIAIEIDTLRAAIGDDKFDERFGSTRTVVPASRRLRVRQGRKHTPVEGRMKSETAKGTFGKRPVKKGDWVYFYNHPKYLMKHPAGAFQGENAVYVGDDAAGRQLFEGLGVKASTERAMLEKMVDAYKPPRTPYDYARLLEWQVPNAPEVKNKNQKYRDRDRAYFESLYRKYEHRIDAKWRDGSSEYPAEVTVAMILNDPPYKIGETTRKGGYAGVARRLDPAKVKELAK